MAREAWTMSSSHACLADATWRCSRCGDSAARS
eukprot:COSAG01_NODE_14037_length_1504_cov_1.223488_1_plen_32_part_10